MGLTSDEFTARIGDTEIAVTGTTGPVQATWRLLVDGVEADSAAAAGDFQLRGQLPDGTAVAVTVHQSLVGPTRVVISHQGIEVLNAKGFVA